MTNKLSIRINNLPVSATLEMAAKARELKENGVVVLKNLYNFRQLETLKQYQINCLFLLFFLKV